MHECPLVPSCWNGATVLLCNCLLSPRDPDDSIVPPVVAVHQVDNQLLKTTLCDEEATALDSSYHIEGREILDHVGIRNELVAEGLEAHDEAPTYNTPFLEYILRYVF